ncbi:MAG: DUF3426 domain-containing protein [Gallionella sp.]|nr:DUF3426 domain-containing protein [Gallionella sp.]
MNGTTRCPHCKTRFRVTEAQLMTHAGMVRCGRCQQPFDARPGYKAPDPAAAAGKIEQDAPHSKTDQLASVDYSQKAALQPGVHAKSAESEAGKSDDTLDFSRSPVEVVTSVGSKKISPAEPPVRPAGDAAATDKLYIENSFFHEEALRHTSSDGQRSPEQEDNRLTIRLPQPVGQQGAEGDDSPRKYRAKRRTWLWVTGILLAIMLLVAQSAYFFRVGLSVHLPALKPALSGMCHVLKCTVPLPQNQALISIESSSLDADPAEESRITFNALLRNRAGYTQAYPMLALTLNDSQDKALARRIFPPAEYLPSNESVQTGFTANHEINIKLPLRLTDLKPSGYRLELFYPDGQNP